MAIAPNQLNEGFKKAADDYEKKIDALLDKKILVPGGSVTISAPNGMTEQHLLILKHRYLSVGWKDLKWNSFYDQRDQDNYASIEFKS
jgi:hypothetical protein